VSRDVIWQPGHVAEERVTATADGLRDGREQWSRQSHHYYYHYYYLQHIRRFGFHNAMHYSRFSYLLILITYLLTTTATLFFLLWLLRR